MKFKIDNNEFRDHQLMIKNFNDIPVEISNNQFFQWPLLDKVEIRAIGKGRITSNQWNALQAAAKLIMEVLDVELTITNFMVDGLL